MEVKMKLRMIWLLALTFYSLACFAPTPKGVWCAQLSGCSGGAGCLGPATVDTCKIECSLGGEAVCESPPR